MVATTTFGKAVKKKLVDLEKPQTWLIEQVREKTGMYFDDSYLGKLLNGTLSTPKMMGAIRQILDLEEETHGE